LRSSCRVYSAGLHRRPRGVRHRVPLRLAAQEVRHFSSRHRTRLPVSAAPCAGAGRLVRRVVLSQRHPKVSLLDRFRPSTFWADVATSRSSRPGCTPHATVSRNVLRLLSVWLVHLFNHVLAGMAKCSRPTVFGGPPLLTGYPDLLRSAPGFHRSGDQALAGPCLAV
jgi:hypothetical protein